jgi:chemotaxis protein MotB
MRKRRAKGGEGGHERWLVSYADFITLMFAFFVVMFSAAHVEQQKVGKLARSIQGAFLELSIMPSSGSRNIVRDLGQYPDWSLGRVELLSKRSDLGWPGKHDADPTHFMPGDNALSTLRERLERQLKEARLQGLLRLVTEPRGLTISLAEVALFDSGSAALRPQAVALVDRISGLLAPVPQTLRIEGHTDDRPISNQRYASNWELSAARATFVLSYLIKRGHDPARLAAAGYGEYRPVASNETTAGRSMNRRVDIVVLNPRAMAEEPASPAGTPTGKFWAPLKGARSSVGSPRSSGSSAVGMAAWPLADEWPVSRATAEPVLIPAPERPAATPPSPVVLEWPASDHVTALPPWATFDGPPTPWAPVPR